MLKEKVALFDFCETLVNFQTADAYVDYVREIRQTKLMLRKERVQILLRKAKLIQIFEKITQGRYSINKRIKLWQLRGIKSKELESLSYSFYQNKIRPNLIPELNNILKILQKEGYEVYVVSGGYDIYLKFFIAEFNLKGCISSQIKMVNGICTGRMSGLDCLRTNKTILLNKYFGVKPKYSIAFSDSITDLPLLQWVDKGCVVSKNKHQSWSDKYNLEEIIWILKK